VWEKLLSLASDMRVPYVSVFAKDDDIPKITAAWSAWSRGGGEERHDPDQNQRRLADTAKLRDLLDHFACDRARRALGRPTTPTATAARRTRRRSATSARM
jgi:hypothetical protein